MGPLIYFYFRKDIFRHSHLSGQKYLFWWQIVCLESGVFILAWICMRILFSGYIRYGKTILEYVVNGAWYHFKVLMLKFFQSCWPLIHAWILFISTTRADPSLVQWLNPFRQIFVHLFRKVIRYQGNIRWHDLSRPTGARGVIELMATPQIFRISHQSYKAEIC